MGLLKKGWVWIVMNNISPVLRNNSKLPNIEELDGLMFVSGLWDCMRRHNLHTFYSLLTL